MTEPVHEVRFFEVPKRPTGGTVYMAYLPSKFPTGGGTVYVDPRKSGNPDGRIDEDPELCRPVVDIQLPAIEEEQ